VLCVIVGFRREVDENSALLGYYAASSGNSLPTLLDAWPLKMGQISSPETSVRNYNTRYVIAHNIIIIKKKAASYYWSMYLTKSYSVSRQISKSTSSLFQVVLRFYNSTRRLSGFLLKLNTKPVPASNKEAACGQPSFPSLRLHEQCSMEHIYCHFHEALQTASEVTLGRRRDRLEPIQEITAPTTVTN